MRLKDYSDNDPKFYAWLVQADDIVNRQIGLSLLDLPDWGWRDAFDDGRPVSEAVTDFLEDEGYGDDLQD